MITFENLWKTMESKGVNQYKLIKDYGFSPAQITRLKRNSNINTHTINRLCEILDCEVENICKFHKEQICSTHTLLILVLLIVLYQLTVMQNKYSFTPKILKNSTTI